MDVLFNCPICGFEEVYDVDEDTKSLECGFCRNGVMDRVGICEELPYMVKMERD